MSFEPTIYADDTDATWTFTVTRADGEDIDWADPVVAIGAAGYTVDGEWQGTAGPERQIKVPLDGLSAGTTSAGKSYNLYLRVPGGTDILLGKVKVKTRT